MLTHTSLAAQLAAQRDDPVRVLVVGAGIAGITLAQLLRRDGLHPVLIDRAHDDAHPGYMLALLPNADAAIADLGAMDRYRALSVPLERYRFRSHRGRILRTDPLGALLQTYGDYRGISRGELIEVLTDEGCEVTFGATVTSVARAGGGERTAELITADGTAVHARFDLIVGADGIRSRMRDVLGAGEIEVVDTHWAGWVAWAEDADGDPGLGEELWGAGFFLGVYPVRGRLGVFLGGPATELAGGPRRFAQTVRDRLAELPPRLSAAVDAIAADDDPYLWHLDDARVRRWVLPDGVLLGDAAAGFLPTAGVGAAMAMESAWMLARMLRGTDRRMLHGALTEWERIERPRVESAQQNSRTLARLMFRRGRVIAWLREVALRVLTVRAALGPIVRLVAERPDPGFGSAGRPDS